MGDTKALIKLTHLRTNKPTYINVGELTGVRENDDGVTLVLTKGTGQYVKESVDEVLRTLSLVGFEII
jgi:uncharacterized protein YlzI (FlbEa/FlbD family)